MQKFLQQFEMNGASFIIQKFFDIHNTLNEHLEKDFNWSYLHSIQETLFRLWWIASLAGTHWNWSCILEEANILVKKNEDKYLHVAFNFIRIEPSRKKKTHILSPEVWNDICFSFVLLAEIKWNNFFSLNAWMSTWKEEFENFFYLLKLN